MGEISDEGSTAFLLQAIHKLSQSTLTHVQQYHVWDLECCGIIQKTRSPYYSPVWPFHKPNSTWHLTTDHYELNENTRLLHAAVTSVTVLINEVSTQSEFYKYLFYKYYKRYKSYKGIKGIKCIKGK